MQFDFRLKKYLNKKAEKDWELLIKPPQKMYDSFIVVPAKAESKNIPQLLDSISNQNKDYLEKCGYTYNGKYWNKATQILF